MVESKVPRVLSADFFVAFYSDTVPPKEAEEKKTWQLRKVLHGCKSRCGIDEVEPDMLRLSEVERDNALRGSGFRTMRDDEPIHVGKVELIGACNADKQNEKDASVVSFGFGYAVPIDGV